MTAALERRRHCLVLTQCTANVERFAEQLRQRGLDPVVLRGGMSGKSAPAVPFGGAQNSGYGREFGHFGPRSIANAKTIWIAGEPYVGGRVELP